MTPFLAGVGSIAFGAFDAPDYETASKVIPAVGTRTGVPAVQGTNRLYFNLFLPPGTLPRAGGRSPSTATASRTTRTADPVPRRRLDGAAGDRDDRDQRRRPRLRPARDPDRQPHGRWRPSCSPAGGRGFDQNGNGAIDSTEGVNAAPPQTLVGSRDGLRQTVIDLMSLVREIEVGVDVDGNGTRDLDPAKISYFGQSFGGIYGTKFLAVEPNVRAGRPERSGRGDHRDRPAEPGLPCRSSGSASTRTALPPLVNLPGRFAFNENMPLRNLPPVVDTVPGASAIQQLIEWTEWTSQSGNPVAYAPHLRAQPLSGVPAKSVILQFARTDQTVPNPTTSAIIRAGGLQDRTTLFRNDLAFAADSDVPEEPAHVPDQCAGARAGGCRAPWRSRPRIRSRSSSPPTARWSSIPTAPGRSSRRRWSAHRRRIWRTSHDLGSQHA